MTPPHFPVMNPPFDPIQAAADFPMELVQKYTLQQLADAVAMRMVVEGQELTRIMREIEAMVKVVEAADPAFTLYPAAAQLHAERKDLFDAAAKMVALGRAYSTTVADTKRSALELQTRYLEYVRAVTAAVRPNEDTPRG